MSNIYGPGVGRNLSSKDKQYKSVVFQPNTPPVAEEFNLLTETMDEARKEIVNSNIPSGFISNPYHSKADYEFSRRNSNQFWMGKESADGHSGIVYANVNGWVIPVAGTRSSDLRNVIQLDPPPTSSHRTDFVFLEVWKAPLSPDGEINKPSEDLIYRFGNVEYGGINLTNQILDPRFKKETSERVQLQYRIRVRQDVNPTTNPYGFGDSLVQAQGPKSSPISGIFFENMGEELGDSGLWRAGEPNEVSEDGREVESLSPLDTTDGFVYAIPICFVFRRSNGFWNTINQNESVNRNPNASSREDASLFPMIGLAEDITATQETFEVNQSRAETTFPQNGILQVDNEIIIYSDWSGTTVEVDQRGARDSHKTSHLEDSEILHVSGHPLGYFSDQVVSEDVFDLRHITNISGFSYDSLLKTNFISLIKGDLKTQWKEARGSYKGTRHFQVDHFGNEQAGASHYEADAPDNFRKIFSDACSLQPNNLLAIRPSTTSGTIPGDDFTFNPSGEIYKQGLGNPFWETGDNIKITLDQFRQTFKTVNDKKVRFVHPNEYKDSDHDPLRILLGDDTYVEGLGKNFIALGKSPENVAGVFLAGTSSDIQFNANSIVIAGNPSLDFSTDNTASLLADQEAYLVIETADDSLLGFKGVYKILGSDGNDGLEVALPDGDLSNPQFTAETHTGNWYILLREVSEEDDNLVVVLTHPLPSDLGITEFAENESLYMTYDLLYHPSQGLVRVPEIPLFTRLETENVVDPYVKPNHLANQVSSSTSDVKDFTIQPMASFPLKRSETRVRNNQDAKTSVEDTWAESYVDRGSKTLLFQPLQRSSIYIDVDSNPTGSTSNYGDSLTMGDDDFGFNLANGSSCYFVPKEVLPPTGRVDLPFVSNTSSDSPYGLNAILQPVNGDGDLQNPAIAQNRVLALYETGLDMSIIASVNATDALPTQIYDEGGVRGIELPAHFGVCRIFAAYEKGDFEANGSAFLSGSNYTSLSTGTTATNLLREDHKGRSLLITENNTFVLPEQILDLNLLGNDLAQSEIVFELAIFMFNDWKQDRVQIHTHGIESPSSSLEMLINGPARDFDVIKQVSTRIPYQGNINGSMPDSASLTFSDYAAKRHVDRTEDIEIARGALNQRDALVSNPAKLEILASMPFVTTLGTGRISGEVVEGSYTDVGYISQSGFPDDLEDSRTSRTRGLVFGNGNVQQSRPDILTGMTERLPAGLLASDHLFIGEGFLGSQLKFWTPSETSDLAGCHVENKGGQLLAKTLQEGSVMLSDGTSQGNPEGPTYSPDADLYRTYRGGVLMEASGNSKGGVFLVSGPRLYKDFPQLRSFEAEHNQLIASLSKSEISVPEFEIAVEDLQQKYQKRLQVNGGALFGVAFLVRTSKETAGDSDHIMNWGHELQMLVATGASLGTQETLNQLEGDWNTREVLDLLIQLHPTGLGENFCAADRYHVQGRILQKESKENSDLDLEIYRGSDPVDDPDPKC